MTSGTTVRAAVTNQRWELDRYKESFWSSEHRLVVCGYNTEVKKNKKKNHYTLKRHFNSEINVNIGINFTILQTIRMPLSKHVLNSEKYSFIQVGSSVL